MPRHTAVSRASVADIVHDISGRFRTFGGGREPTDGNPIAHALKNHPLQFAAGVDVLDVVLFVLDRAGVKAKGQ